MDRVDLDPVTKKKNFWVDLPVYGPNFHDTLQWGSVNVKRSVGPDLCLFEIMIFHDRTLFLCNLMFRYDYDTTRDLST